MESRSERVRSNVLRGRIATTSCMLVGFILASPPFASAETRVESAADTCVIDMGSNSFKRIVGRFEEGVYRQRGMDKRTLGVGDDLARHGRISHLKLGEIEQTLSEFARACEEDGAIGVSAIGTAAFREAPNVGSVVQIASKLGISMEVASEERESRLAYLVGSLGRDDFAVIDNGSRSIELASKEAGSAIRHAVFNLGYRVAFTKFFADSVDPHAAIDAFRARLLPELADASFMKGRKKLVGVEFEEMVDVLFPAAPTDGRFISRADLQRRLAQISEGGPEAFATLMKSRDIDRALPRLVVAATLCAEFGYEGIELTDRELGSGLIIEAGLKETPRSDSH